MKTAFVLLLLISFNLSNAQTSTKKYNSYLERYEYFNSDGEMVGYQTYNSYLDQWEYTEINNSNNNSSYYDNIPIYEPNYELINKVLATKETKYNTRMKAAEEFLSEVAQQLGKKYGKDVQVQFAILFGERLESITDRNGKINVYNDEIFRRYKNIIISSYQDAVNSQVKVPEKSDKQLAIEYYNFGVNDQKSGNNQNAIQNYETAIKLNPNLTDAYLNIAVVILEEEKPIIDEMNTLGLSKKDNERYDYLNEKRQKLYLKVEPYLEKLVELDSENSDVQRTLKNIRANIDVFNNQQVEEGIDVSTNNNNPNIYGGYIANKIYEYDTDGKGGWILKRELDLKSKLFFKGGKYYFQRGENNWKENLWTFSGIDDKTERYFYYDNFGQTIVIDKDITRISWYFDKNEEGRPKKLIMYRPLRKDDTVIPD